MKTSPFTPTWRSGLVLAVGFSVAAMVLPLIPDQDDPRVSAGQVSLAVLMGILMVVVGLIAFIQGRIMDRLVTLLTAAAVSGIFYLFIHRAV